MTQVKAAPDILIMMYQFVIAYAIPLLGTTQVSHCPISSPPQCCLSWLEKTILS